MSSFEEAKAEFLHSIATEEHAFANTLAFIDTWFNFSPSAFMNGSVENREDQNQGSCKVFSMSQLLGLTQEQTLRCFGEHYRDVLKTPTVDNHHNLRRVLREGTSNISFANFPLLFKD